MVSNFKFIPYFNILQNCVQNVRKPKYPSILAGPGLAQLVERLAHRYSESTSLNPSNLNSATVCGDRMGCMLATKRLASVAPEVDLGECTLHLPLQKANKAEPTLALNPRGDVTRNPKKGYQWPQKRTCVRQKLKKKSFCTGAKLK